MATIDYPKGLPLPLRKDYGFNHVNPKKSVELASGRDRERRWFTGTPTRLQVSWLMSAGQAQAFELWFQQDLVDGVEWFNCPLKTPMGIGPHEAKFVGIYSGPYLVGVNHWRITAELRLSRRPLAPSEWAGFYEWLIYSDVFDIAMNDKWPEP